MFCVLYSAVLETYTAEAELAREIAGRPAGQARQAEAELYRRLAPRVRLYGLRHLRDEQAAADLTQQVLLITIQGLRSGSLRDPDQLVSFVLGTCRMVVLDLRRNAQRRERLLAEFGRDFPSVVATPEYSLDQDQLARCMQALAERERTVIVMSFYDEQTSEDVAGFLGLSVANVRVIRHRALGHLRQCMSAPGGAA
jgi:RNA polymerase sigma-70 factor (ECF subfamily)